MLFNFCHSFLCNNLFSSALIPFILCSFVVFISVPFCLPVLRVLSFIYLYLITDKSYIAIISSFFFSYPIFFCVYHSFLFLRFKFCLYCFNISSLFFLFLFVIPKLYLQNVYFIYLLN